MKRTAYILSLFLALLVILSATSCAFGGASPEAGTTAAVREGTENDNSAADATTDAAATDEITTGAAQTEPTPPELVEYSYAGITISIPADFKEIDQGGTKQLVPADYPEHADNISLTVGAGSASVYTEELLRSTVTQLLGDVQDFTYTRDTFSGLDRVIISYGVNVSGVFMMQENVSIFSAGKVYSVTFTTVSDDFNDVFTVARDSIKITDDSNGTEAAPAEPVEYSYSGITLTVPGDFAEFDQSGVRLLVPADYPARADNISFTVTAGSVTGYTEEIVVASLKQFLGDIQDFAFAKDKQDGLDRIVFSYSMTVNGVSMRQESVNLFKSGKVYSVTFTNVTNDFADAFETAKNSIKITG